MTDFQEAYGLLDDGKLFLEDLSDYRSNWIGKSREAHYEGRGFNYYFSVLKDCDDVYFSRDWVCIEVICNTFMSPKGSCWVYISLRDCDDNVCHLEATISEDDGWEYYCLARDFALSIDCVSRAWLDRINDWLKGEYFDF